MAKLMTSYLIVISILFVFSLFSFKWLSNQIHTEVIRYNEENLRATTEQYETHFDMIQKLALSLYLNDRLQILRKSDDDTSYLIASQLRSDIQGYISNPLLFMENVILLFQQRGFILEKDGTASKEKLFSSFYISEAYPLDVWESILDKQEFSKIYPVSVFSERSIGARTTRIGRLFPMVVKNRAYPDIDIVVFVDALKMYEQFHRSVQKPFAIYDEEGQLLYSTFDIQNSSFQLSPDPARYVRHGEHYFFQRQGTITGLTYVNMVETESITDKVNRLFFIFSTVLLVVMLLAVGASLFFSRRLNDPVRKIIESIQRLDADLAPGHRPNEFELINNAIQHLKRTQEDIHHDLQAKNSLLRSFAYVNKLKNIHQNFGDLQHIFPEERSYRFILFTLHFKPRFHQDIEVGTHRATYFIREYIKQKVAGSYPEAQTFQVESNQILTIVFDSDESKSTLLHLLDEIKAVFGLDMEYCHFTIAVGDLYTSSTSFKEAYEEVLQLGRARLLNDETQIISELPTKEAEFQIHPSQEAMLLSHLEAGHVQGAFQLVERILDQTVRKDVPALQIVNFTEEVLKRIRRALPARQLGKVSEALNEATGKLQKADTLKELKQSLLQAVEVVCESFKANEGEKDYIVTFVKDYVEKHYQEDITLEILADKLNLSAGYLSTYFKEKTERNFLDYLNEKRVAEAKTLLLTSGIKIQDAALQAGYQNLNSFNRMFKKYTGMTPSDFRKSHL